jgi:phosphatidylserine/phosphatidylglycerophosphate/cardiolipin synthase-like enzyme
MHLSSILRARRSIYLENQYFASPVIAEALAQRLAEADGPEVVLVSAEHSPSYFDQMTMDQARVSLLRRLRAADRFGRFRAYYPRTAEGGPIIVHSKVAVIDDRLVRIGSANLNNRSGGFDTECDVAIEARTPGEQAEIARFRARLIAHWLAAAPGEVDALVQARGLVEALDSLTEHTARLIPLKPVGVGPLGALIGAYHLGDPLDPLDSWRPLMRRRRTAREVERLASGAGPSVVAGDPEVDH